MKRNLAYIGNVLAILVGLLGLEAPLVTDGVIAIGIGGFMDPSLLQPLFIGFVILAIIGHFYKVRETMAFMPIILQFVFGILAFVFIFPVRIDIVGYLALLGFIYVMFSPYLSKLLNKKNIQKIKA
jgi:hypothetical protein